MSGIRIWDNGDWERWSWLGPAPPPNGYSPGPSGPARALSFISPAAVFSNCWIFTSASASFSWQVLAKPVPSSYLASNVSRGKSSDSIADTIDSSFFKASSNGTPAALAGLLEPAFFGTLGTMGDYGITRGASSVELTLRET